MFAWLTHLHPPQEPAGALSLRTKHASIKVSTLHKQSDTQSMSALAWTYHYLRKYYNFCCNAI